MGDLVKDLLADLPKLPFGSSHSDDHSDILEKLSAAEKKANLKVGIKDVPFKDIDPGIFNNELIKLHIYACPDSKNLANPPHIGTGNITKGTYSGTQAALTHAYNRIERAYESYFDVLQVEPTLPRFIDMKAKQDIYQFSPYPKNADGSVAQYPPHLSHIPSADNVSVLRIFNALGLAETQLILKQVMPDTFVGKTARWLLSKVDGDISQAASQGPKMKDYEEYNKHHRKSGTDIEVGKNIGLLPDWYSDRRFADQSFTGTNPTSIKTVPTDLLREFIDTAHRLEDEYWASTLPDISPASLFVQDCRYFRQAVGADPNAELHHKEPLSDSNWACASVTLFELHENGKLHPIAIVCDYKTSMENSVTIFNKRHDPTDSTESEASDWPWRYAKTCAQVSDWILHEVGVHLTRAHLIEEATIVATHRAFPMDHIVYKILSPHWYKTLSLNAAARDTLVPQVIKDLVGFNPDQLYQFIRYEFETFDWTKNYIPNDLAGRGFPNTAEGLGAKKYKNYAYAKNMLSMWTSIRKYVMSMLLMYYDSETADRMVQEDNYVKNWCKEVQDGGYIKTFPNIQTLDELCDAVTMCIHIASPFHSAVNYLQNFYQSFVPSKPPTLCQPLPASLAELQKYTETDLMNSLPVNRQREWLLAVQVPWLLSFKAPGDRSLKFFARSQWQAHREATDENQEIQRISELFYQDLQRLDYEFTLTSNAMDEGSIPYMVMDPDNLAVSILI